jgi:hypothetical protein
MNPGGVFFEGKCRDFSEHKNAFWREGNAIAALAESAPLGFFFAPGILEGLSRPSRTVRA